MSDLYQNILRLCEKKGIKGGRLCSDLGLSRGFMTDLKMGRKTSISTDTLKKLTKYFDVEASVILDGEPAEETKKDIVVSNDARDDLIHRLNHMSTSELLGVIADATRIIQERG